MMLSIKGFCIDWAGPPRVLAEREVAPKHKYEFEASSDWQRIVRLISVSPDGDSVEDTKRFEKEAGKAVEEFLRQKRGDK